MNMSRTSLQVSTGYAGKPGLEGIARTGRASARQDPGGCQSAGALGILLTRQPTAGRHRPGVLRNPAGLRPGAARPALHAPGLRPWLWAALASFLAGPLTARAQPTNASPSLDYQSFKLIADRNIFDPNRAPRAARAPRAESRRPARTESFSLVGTLSYEKGAFAFFDGSSSEYRKALKCGDTIAGYKICEITAKGVKLETNGQQIELPVGGQMRRQDEEEWAVASGAAPASQASAPGSNEEADGSSGSRSGSDGDENDVVKRLLQKRQQELNR